MLAKRSFLVSMSTAGASSKASTFVGLRDAGDPVESRTPLQRQGADELTFSTFTASTDERDRILHVVEQVRGQVFIPLTVGAACEVGGGGPVRRLLNAGPTRFHQHRRVQNPQLVADAAGRYGVQCIVVAIDAKQRKSMRIRGIRWKFLRTGDAGRDWTPVEWARLKCKGWVRANPAHEQDRDGTAKARYSAHSAPPEGGTSR